MAFSETQKVQIRFFLGYPFAFQYLNPRLESAISLVGDNAPAQAIVEGLLGKLVKFYGIDPNDPGGPAQVDKAIGQAGVKRVESVDDVVEFGTTSGSGGASSSAILNAQNDTARQMVGALSSMMGVEIANDVFGKTGYSGDGWSARSNQMSRIGSRTVLMGA